MERGGEGVRGRRGEGASGDMFVIVNVMYDLRGAKSDI